MSWNLSWEARPNGRSGLILIRGSSTGCKLPCKIVSVLDAGVHSEAASWREAMCSITWQEDIACLQQFCSPQKAMCNDIQALSNTPSASHCIKHARPRSRTTSLVPLCPWSHRPRAHLELVCYFCMHAPGPDALHIHADFWLANGSQQQRLEDIRSEVC